MRRRAFLAAGGAGVLTALAGCSEIDIPLVDEEERHPFADRTVDVRVDNESDTDHDIERNARDALDFWEAESEQYADFEVDFEMVDSEDAEFVIRYRDDPSGCEDVEGYSPSVLGCAPVLRSGSRIPDPVVASVVAGDRPFGKIRITTKHEIGHVLGLGHDDNPREIMSNRPEDRIPLYDLRIEIWEQINDGRDHVADGLDRFREGVGRWNDREYERASERFERARESFLEASATFDRCLEQTAEFEGHPRVETVDLSGLRGALDQLNERIDAAITFASLMKDASDAATADDMERAESLRSQANGEIARYSELPVPEMRTIAVALGLVRGFDRDEDVIDDVDGETEGEN